MIALVAVISFDSSDVYSFYDILVSKEGSSSVGILLGYSEWGLQLLLINNLHVLWHIVERPKLRNPLYATASGHIVSQRI